jgi:DNA-directed RNA polymerase subunit L
MNELILEIMKIALDKNSENKNTIFIRYSGHVEWLEVEVYQNGWSEKETSNFYKKIKLNDGYTTEENIKKELREILNYLKKL